jgi:hypothetical protein
VRRSGPPRAALAVPRESRHHESRLRLEQLDRIEPHRLQDSGLEPLDEDVIALDQATDERRRARLSKVDGDAAFPAADGGKICPGSIDERRNVTCEIPNAGALYSIDLGAEPLEVPGACRARQQPGQIEHTHV